MELKQISYFLKIIECGSLSKAAKSLYLTQPTLSRFLEKLEADAGVKLFARSKNNNLSLTAAGKVYLEAATKIQKIWSDLDTNLSPMRKDKNQITFGIDGDHMAPFAAQCATKVMQAFPEVSVDFFCDCAEEIQRRVAEGSLQMGLCAYNKKHPLLTFSLCSKCEINLVVDQNHPLAKYAYTNPGMENYRLDLHKLEPDTAFAMMLGSSVWQEDVQNYLYNAGYTPNIKRTYIRLASIGDVLSGTNTVGFCPANSISPRLSYIALQPPAYFHQGVCRHKNATVTPAEKYLFSLLLEKPAIRTLS